MMENVDFWLGKSVSVERYPNVWREIPGYSAYAVNRVGEVVGFDGRIIPEVVPGGRLRYTLDQKFKPRFVGTPGDLIMMAFPEIDPVEARKNNYYLDVLAKTEEPVNKAVSKVPTMEIIVMPPNGPGRIFRGQKPETVVEVIDAVKYGRGFILEDYESDAAFTYAPGAAAMVQTKVEK